MNHHVLLFSRGGSIPGFESRWMYRNDDPAKKKRRFFPPSSVQNWWKRAPKGSFFLKPKRLPTLISHTQKSSPQILPSFIGLLKAKSHPFHFTTTTAIPKVTPQKESLLPSTIIMLLFSTLSAYLSAFKKRHLDDLPDYVRGSIAGIVMTRLALVTVELGFLLFRWRRP